MTKLTIALGALALVTAPSIPTGPARTAPARTAPATEPSGVSAAALGQRRAVPAAVTPAAFFARIDNGYRAPDTNHEGVVTAD